MDQISTNIVRMCSVKSPRLCQIPHPRAKDKYNVDAAIVLLLIYIQDVDRQNHAIEIKNTSDFQNVSESLCSFMMYDDFLRAYSGNSSKLQVLQTVLQENINDRWIYTLLKQQSAISGEVNITIEPGSGDTLNQNVCPSDSLSNLRVHCLEQSLINNFVATPYFRVFRVIQTQCFNDEGSCGWISRHFEEPERSMHGC